MDRFPLFQLPTVALSEVIKTFCLFDITMLSLCSKRTQRWIKAFRCPRDALKINLVSRKHERVFLYSDSQNLTFNITTFTLEMLHSLEIGDFIIPLSVEKDGERAVVNLFFDDKMEGVRLITEYLCWFFQINISNVVITKYSNLVDPVAVIDWVIRRQNKLECLMIESKKAERTSDKTARDILSKINHSANVLINFDLSPNFKTSLKFEGKLLKIRNGHWFTLDNLFSVNCSILNVKRTFLDVGDMNEFLKHWIASDLKFKEINIKMTEVISDALFSEIEFVKQPKDVERVYKSYDGLTTIYGGYDIQRNDGLWATIDSNRFEESIDFRMIIWDEQEQ